MARAKRFLRVAKIMVIVVLVIVIVLALFLFFSVSTRVTDNLDTYVYELPYQKRK